jgi:hypothetical protein
MPRSRSLQPRIEQRREIAVGPGAACDEDSASRESEKGTARDLVVDSHECRHMRLTPFEQMGQEVKISGPTFKLESRLRGRSVKM